MESYVVFSFLSKHTQCEDRDESKTESGDKSHIQGGKYSWHFH